MTKSNRQALTDGDLDAALRAWMEPGVQSLSAPVLERTVAAVRTSRQVSQRPAQRLLHRTITAARFTGLAAAAVVTVAAVAVLWGGWSLRQPAGPGSAPAQASALPVAPPSPANVTPSPSPVPRVAPAVSGVVLNGLVAATSATYQVRYPEVEMPADPAVAAAVNTALRGEAERTVSDFTAGIGKDPQAGPGQPSTLQADFTVAYRSPGLLSLRVSAYAYPSGAAHGTTVVATHTFDLVSGRQLALADLFRPGSAYLEALATEARTQLRATLASWLTDSSMTDWLTTGTAPSADDYAAWAITPGGLEITFTQYQVAPYAAGMPVVTIPFAHLAGLIDPAGPLGPLTTIPLPSATVSLGIYSGAPDPSWTLSDWQVADLLGRLDSLPVQAGSPPAGGLGYHGFSIIVQRPGQPDQVLTAYRGAVVGPGEPPGTYRADPGRTVESALLDTGRARLKPSEVAAVEADLAVISRDVADSVEG